MGKRFSDEDIASALLIGGTITRTAEILGVNRCKLSKRANSEPVQDLVHQKRTELFSASCSRLIEASTSAIEVLVDTLHNKKASTGQKLRACELLLTNAFRAYELIDLSNDLRALKQEFEELKERR